MSPQHCVCFSRLDLLDFTLLDSLLIQVLDELLSLHPIDEWADFTAVAEEGSARQVEGTSCLGKDRETKKIYLLPSSKSDFANRTCIM